MTAKGNLGRGEAGLVFWHMSDLVAMRGQADAATETFSHLDRFFFATDHDVFSVQKRLHKHVGANWSSGFFEALEYLRRRAADRRAAGIRTIVAAADELVARHDLVRQVDEYSHPDHTADVFYPALLAAERAARTLSALVGAVAAEAVADAPRSLARPIRAAGDAPAHPRSHWEDVRRVPSRIWRPVSRHRAAEWPEMREATSGDGELRELTPAEILGRRLEELSRPIVTIVTPAAELTLTGLHAAVLTQLRTSARRQVAQPDAARFRAGDLADRLLVRASRVSSALSEVLDTGLAEPDPPGKARATAARDGTWRITHVGERALDAVRRASRAGTSHGTSPGTTPGTSPGTGPGASPGAQVRTVRIGRPPKAPETPVPSGSAGPPLAIDAANVRLGATHVEALRMLKANAAAQPKQEQAIRLGIGVLAGRRAISADEARAAVRDLLAAGLAGPDRPGYRRPEDGACRITPAGLRALDEVTASTVGAPRPPTTAGGLRHARQRTRPRPARS